MSGLGISAVRFGRVAEPGFPAYRGAKLSLGEEVRLDMLMRSSLAEIREGADPISLDVAVIRHAKSHRVLHTLMGPRATYMKAVSNVYERMRIALNDDQDAKPIFTNLVRDILQDPHANPFELEFVSDHESDPTTMYKRMKF
jgi:hypothetical protein